MCAATAAEGKRRPAGFTAARACAGRDPERYGRGATAHLRGRPARAGDPPARSRACRGARRPARSSGDGGRGRRQRHAALRAPAAGPPAEVGQVVRARAGRDAVPAAGLRDSRRAAPDGQGDHVGLSGDAAASGPRPHVGNAWLWDPAAGYGSNAFKQVAPPDGSPIYCSGESLLANGNLFIAGGNLADIGLEGPERDVHVQPLQRDLASAGRHGPRALVPRSGRAARRTRRDPRRVHREGEYPEQLPARGVAAVAIWRRPTTPTATPRACRCSGSRAGDRTTALYPHLFLTPAGKVLLAGPGANDSALLDPRTLHLARGRRPTRRPGSHRQQRRAASWAALGCCRSAGTTTPRSSAKEIARARHLHRVRRHQRPPRLEDSVAPVRRPRVRKHRPAAR